MIRVLKPFLKRGRSDLTCAPEQWQKVLFLRPDKIGDTVISLPVFQALRERFPNLQIHVMGSPGNRSLLEHDNRIDKLYTYTKRLDSIGIMRRMRAEKYDCVFDMIAGDSATNLIISQMLGKRVCRVGLGKKAHAEWYDYNLPMSTEGHIIRETLKLLEPLGIDSKSVSPFAPPAIPEETDRQIAWWITDLSREGRIRVGVNLSAGKTNRLWPLDKWRKLMIRIYEEMPDVHMVLITVPDDRKVADCVMFGMEQRLTLVPDKLSLLGACAIIKRLHLLISPDTSLIHVARSFSKPVVGLYNNAPGNILRWGPFEQPDGAVLARDIDTVYDIAVDQVLSKLSEVRDKFKVGVA